MDLNLKKTIVIPGWIDKLAGALLAVFIIASTVAYCIYHSHHSSNFIANNAPIIALSPIALAMLIGGIYLYVRNRNSSIWAGLGEIIADSGYSVWQLFLIGFLWIVSFYWIAQWSSKTFPIKEDVVEGTIVKTTDASHIISRYKNGEIDKVESIPTKERIPDGVMTCCVKPGDPVHILFEGNPPSPFIVFGHGPYTPEGNTTSTLRFLFSIMGLILVPGIALLYRAAKMGIQWRPPHD